MTSHRSPFGIRRCPPRGSPRFQIATISKSSDVARQSKPDILVWCRPNSERILAMLKLKDEMLLRGDAYVDGAWVSARSGERFKVTNKASGDVIAEVANFDVADVRSAI